MAPHEALNSIACTVLLVAMLPLATIADVRRNTAHTLLMLAAEFAFFMQIITPFSDLLPPVTWQIALLTTVQALCVLVYRRRLWQFARHELIERKAPHPLRRVSDLPDTQVPQGQQ